MTKEGDVEMSYKEKYQSWLEHEYFDELTKEELRLIGENEKEIEDRFYTELEFGTAGLRGVIGAGINRMNIYVVRKATQGFSNYLLNLRKIEAPQVAIAYDSRNMSYEFAKEAGQVFAANGIKVYIFESLRPVPELSFTVRELKCHGGIVITASHNPPEYNGYKVYGEDGAQVIAPFDNMIIDEVNRITDFNQVKHISQEEAEAANLLTWIGQEVDDKYIAKVKEQAINLESIQEVADDFKIVYTPIHGTGNKPVRRILQEIGFKHIHIVEEQELPDGKFPTVESPNPEDTKAFKLALELAKKVDADIVMGTDPDADRVGVLIKNPEGEYQALTGNMLGAMLTDYLLSQKASKGMLKDNSVVIKTIVTTEMTRAIAESFNAELMEVLTGFKYIGEQIRLFEETGDKSYVFGFEESYGYLAGTYARDKDAVVACMLAAEMAAYYKSQGMTLYEALIALYEKYGYYKESILSITLKGIEGMGKIGNIMNNLRELKLENLASFNVLAKRDYKLSKRVLNSTAQEDILLPKSNVLYYELSDCSWVCIRPSGTEPKIKFYFGVKADSIEAADKELASLEKAIKQIIEPWL